MEPISAIIGVTGVAIQLTILLGKTIDSINTLIDRWKDADLFLLTLKTQLSALGGAVHALRDGPLNSDSSDVNISLRVNIEQLIPCCQELLERVDDFVQDISAERGKIDTRARVRVFFQVSSVEEFQQMIDRQTSSLTLLLAACNCDSLQMQRLILESPEALSLSRQVREDTASIITLRDSQSLRRPASSIASIISRASSLDITLLQSNAYRPVLRSTLNRARRGDHTGRATHSTAISLHYLIVGPKRVNRNLWHSLRKSHYFHHTLVPRRGSDPTHDRVPTPPLCVHHDDNAARELSRCRANIQCTVAKSLARHVGEAKIRRHGLPNSLCIRLMVLIEDPFDPAKMLDLEICEHTLGAWRCVELAHDLEDVGLSTEPIRRLVDDCTRILTSGHAYQPTFSDISLYDTDPEDEEAAVGSHSFSRSIMRTERLYGENLTLTVTEIDDILTLEKAQLKRRLRMCDDAAIVVNTMSEPRLSKLGLKYRGAEWKQAARAHKGMGETPVLLYNQLPVMDGDTKSGSGGTGTFDERQQLEHTETQLVVDYYPKHLAPPRGPRETDFKTLSKQSGDDKNDVGYFFIEFGRRLPGLNQNSERRFSS